MRRDLRHAGLGSHKWEQEASRPREQQMAALAALRRMGKKPLAQIMAGFLQLSEVS